MPSLGSRWPMLNVEVLKARIADAYDIDTVVELLDLSVTDILNAFEDVLISKQDEFDVGAPEEDDE